MKFLITILTTRRPAATFVALSPYSSREPTRGHWTEVNGDAARAGLS